MNKSFQKTSRLSRAYTLMELAIAMGMMGVVGGVIYTVLNGGMILFSKNVATNHSNLTIRGTSARMLQDLHESIGRAELAGADLLPVAAAAAPAIRFPVLINPAPTRVIEDNSGNKVINSVSSTSTVALRITAQPVAPKVGDIAIFPDINDLSGNTLTRVITAVTAGTPTVITVRDLGVNLAISTETPPDPTLVYIARLAAYCLVGNDLRYYPDVANTASFSVVANNLATFLPPLPSGDYVPPFGTGLVPIPVGPFSTPIAGGPIQIQLMSNNTETGARAFKGDRMLLSRSIPPPKCLMVQSTNYN